MRYVLLLLVLAMATGCAKMVNPRFSTEEMDYAYSNHSEYCRQVSIGRTPPPSMVAVPQKSYTASTSGTAYDQYGRGYYYSGTTYYDNSYNYNQATNQNNMALAMYIAQSSAIQNNCMRRLGWMKETELTEPTTLWGKFNRFMSR